MPGVLRDWRAATLIVGVIAQTAVVLVAGHELLVTHSEEATAVVAGAWAALGLLATSLTLLGPLVTESSPRNAVWRPKPDAGRPYRRLFWWVCGLTPPVQIAVLGLLAALSPDATLDLSYFLPGEGVGAVIGGVLLLVLVGYFCELLGLLVLLLVGYPIVLLVVGAHQLIRRRDSGGLHSVLAGLTVVTILPMAIAAVTAIDGPSGRKGAGGRLLVVLGFDLTDYPVVSPGWLWVARILTLLCAAAVAMILVTERRRRKRR